MGQTAQKLAKASQQHQQGDQQAHSPRQAECIRRHKFVEAFGRELGPMLTNTVTKGFNNGVDQLNQLCEGFRLTEEEHNRLTQQALDFAPKFPEWFKKRFSNALHATVGINSTYSEQLINNDLTRLLCANTSERHLQNALHAAFDTAIRNYKAMMCDTGVPVEPVYQDWGVDILLVRTNPANISLMLSLLLERLSVSDNALWIADRTFHTQIFLQLSDLYREISLALEQMAQSHIGP
jgi:hypothetical protein